MHSLFKTMKSIKIINIKKNKKEECFIFIIITVNINREDKFFSTNSVEFGVFILCLQQPSTPP